MRSLCAMCFSLLEKQEMRAGQGSRVRVWRESAENMGFCTLFTSNLASEHGFLHTGTIGIW